MRTLCLNLQAPQEPNCAEIFLALSPRVQFRAPHFIFIDIESTARRLGGEERVLERALELGRELAWSVTGAVADRPPVAQALADYHSGFISPEGKDISTLKGLPLSSLKSLEGLRAWESPRKIENLISFFHCIGVFQMNQIFHFDLPSFRERWGEIGVRVWNRIHGLEPQTISPLEAPTPLKAYQYFDDPVGQLQWLMPMISQSLHRLFLRAQARGVWIQSLRLILHCEYSDQRHLLSIEPVSPSRDQHLFEDLLEQRLEETDFENPIREYEIELMVVPEKLQQLDFFEPRNLDEERWKRLISFAQQADVEVGFLQIEPRHLPEEAWSLKSDWPEFQSDQDLIEKIDGAVQVKSIYAKGLLKAPRPSLLLNPPQLLSSSELAKYRKLSPFPMERMDASWWHRLRHASSDRSLFRDYYLAVTAENSLPSSLAWIFQDRENKQFFLHGFFD